MVVSANLYLIYYTARECDISPYHDDYASINNVPVAEITTDHQSPYTEHVYIFNIKWSALDVFYEVHTYTY